MHFLYLLEYIGNSVSLEFSQEKFPYQTHNIKFDNINAAEIWALS